MTKKFLSFSIVVATLFLSIPATRAAFPVSATKTTQNSQTATPAQITAAQVEEANVNSVVEKVTKAEAKKEKKSFLDRVRAAGGKSQVVALILAALVGALGIHRFYLGYTWQGIVQLLTLGGCGIWSLIDLIRIITGDLQPKNGSYDKTL